MCEKHVVVFLIRFVCPPPQPLRCEHAHTKIHVNYKLSFIHYQKKGKYGKSTLYVPEPAGSCGVVDGPEEPACGRQIGGQRQRGHGGQVLVGAGRVGELHRDGVNAAIGYVVIQLLDGALGFYPLVKADETHPFGQACNTATGQARRCCSCISDWGRLGWEERVQCKGISKVKPECCHAAF